MANRRVHGSNRAKKFLLTAAGVVALTGPMVSTIHAQSPASRFEVVSVKPCKPEDTGGGRGGGGLKPNSFTHGRLTLRCTTVADLIHIAYVSFAGGRFNPLSSVPVRGGPAWVNSDLFSIEATIEGNPNPGTVGGPMLRALLEDRFRLKVRRETSEIPVYELTVAKGGLKMPRFKEGTCAPIDPVKLFSQYPPPEPLAPLPPGSKYCPGPRGAMKGPNVTQDLQASTIDTFIKFVLRDMDRPVVDKTGLTGLFDIHLVFAPDETSDPTLRRGGTLEPNEPSDEPAGLSIFTALE